MDFTNLKNYMDELTAWKIPGNTIRVFKDNKEVFRYSSGLSDVKSGKAMCGDEFFNLYSCSKVALSVAVMQLVESGKLSLDAPLYDYISEFRQMQYRDKDGNIKKAEKPVTIRHLLTMTSGLNYEIYNNILKPARENKTDTLTAVKSISQYILEFEPGERWEYGLSHDVLAGVVEVVSGMKFRDYMKKNVFEPLGMKEVYYHMPESIKDRMATQYRFLTPKEAEQTDAEMIKTPDGTGYWELLPKTVMWYIFNEEYDCAGAGITTNVDDYIKLAAALANKGLGATGERILLPETIELMKVNQLNEKQMKDFNWEQLSGYGYGLGVRTLVDKTSSPGPLGEIGWNGAAGSFILADTENNLAFFYAQHMLNSPSHIIEQKLRNTVYSCLK